MQPGFSAESVLILLKNPVANFVLIGGCSSASEKFHRCLRWL